MKQASKSKSKGHWKLIPFVLLCFSLHPGTHLYASEPDLQELFTPSETTLPSRTQSTNSLCSSFNEFNNLIRDARITKEAARIELTERLGAISADYYLRGGKDYSLIQWVFPIDGYDFTSIDKGKNHGFVPSGYDFFSGNRHGGHPAYDIFIHDRNQDSRDDKTRKPVNVLSMTGGVVVALENTWLHGSGLRGGKYIWVFDPTNKLLVYYAHNEELFVEVGTIVKPGDLLATVGRSGLNAAKRRSPTHLHFSVLRINNGQPVPVRVYNELQRARSLQRSSELNKWPPDSPEGHLFS